MPSARLDNYFKVHRKRAGLTQGELGFLLGWQDEAQVCRLERSRRMPTVKTLLRYEAVFGVPAAELLKGTYERIAAEVARRKAKLVRRLTREASSPSLKRLNQHKLRWLAKVAQGDRTHSGHARKN